MRKIIASCAAIALFAQFTADAKVAGKPAQDKEKKVENVDVNECECEKDLFAGGYISFGFGYGSTKDKLESDLTITATSGTTGDFDANADPQPSIPGTPTQADLQGTLTSNNKLFDSATVTKLEGNEANKYVATIEAKKNVKKSKSHHGLVGSASAGYLWKAGSNGYFGLEGSFGFGGNTTTSLSYLPDAHSTEVSNISLKRSGTNVGLGAVLGYKFGQNYLLYGKVGARSNNVEINPSDTGSYTKHTVSPEFGLGIKKACKKNMSVGLEATYVLNKKVKMNDQGKDYTLVNKYSNNDNDPDTGLYALDNLVVKSGTIVKVGENDSKAVVKSKRTGSWKIALTITMGIN